MNYSYMNSPFGKLLIAGNKLGLARIEFRFGRRTGIPRRDWIFAPRSFRDVERQLREYFRGERRQFKLTLAIAGTAFQRLVWTELQRIPYGATTTYSGLAKSVGKPGAYRAVGAANGRNPLSIVIPCHRVVGSDGGLRGYGGGLQVKAGLLALEQQFPSRRKEAKLSSRSSDSVDSTRIRGGKTGRWKGTKN